MAQESYMMGPNKYAVFGLLTGFTFLFLGYRFGATETKVKMESVPPSIIRLRVGGPDRTASQTTTTVAQRKGYGMQNSEGKDVTQSRIPTANSSNSHQTELSGRESLLSRTVGPNNSQAGLGGGKSSNSASSRLIPSKITDVRVVTPTPNSSTYTKSLLCSQADLSRRAHMTVLTTTNAAFLDITENMLESIKRTGACPIVTVIAEDETSFQKLSQRMKSQPGLRVQKTDAGMTTSGKLTFNSGPYRRFVARRPRYVLNFLQEGLDVLFVDADTFWFKDPFNDFEGDFDIAMLNELTPPHYVFCDGFAYYKPTANTVSLVKEWVRLLGNPNATSLDQIVLNQLIESRRGPKLKVKSLNPSLYPDGQRYFKRPGWRQKNNQTVVLHMTYILGHDAKMAKFKEFGWWLV